MEKKNIKYKVLYSIVLFGIIYLYLEGVTYSDKNISEIVNNYFGRGRYVLLFILISNYFTISVERKSVRDTITLICHMGYPFFLSVYYLLISSDLGILFKLPTTEIQYDFIQLSVFKYKLGLVGTYLLSEMISVHNSKIYLGLNALAILIVLIMSITFFNWVILKNVKKIRSMYIRKKEIENEEKKILKKIEIKEELEKKEVEKISKLRIEREQQIKEKVIEMNPELKKFITESSNEEKNDSSEDRISVLKLSDEVERNDSSI